MNYKIHMKQIKKKFWGGGKVDSSKCEALLKTSTQTIWGEGFGDCSPREIYRFTPTEIHSVEFASV